MTGQSKTESSRLTSNGVRPAGRRLAKTLGVFSLGLGVPSLIRSDVVARLIGLRPTPGTRALMQAVGVQELAAGAGIVARRRPTAFLWSRVLSDVAHLTLLRRAAASDGDKRRIRAASAIVGGLTLLDLAASIRLSRSNAARPNTLKARSTVTIKRPPEDVYRHWRNLENLPSFMYHLESVERKDVVRSHWVAKAPGRRTVEWDADIVEDAANEVIAWRSTDDSRVFNFGTVRFTPAPRDQGTEVSVELEYRPPAGAVGAAVAQLFGEEPNQQISDDLRRLKQVLETGEVVVSDGTETGTLTKRQLRQRPAQPLETTGADR